MRTLVVVGGGMVGHRLVEVLQQRSAAGWQVVVLAEERHPAYDRVALSSYLTGRSAADLSLVPEGFYDQPGRTLHLSARATAVDRAGHRVQTDTGLSVGYDALVLATGSVPFVPPVPGSSADGCFVYRTLDDLDALREYAAGRTSGAVIGGGLLGLEAANALQALGLATHVVEMAPRLMPLQVDEAGGEALRRRITDRGIRVHCGVRTEAVEVAGGRAAGLRLAGGALLPADVVLFSAGIRPRDELARDCGLPVGERGGVLVDRTCRTPDPAVWAIGECASVEGTVHGLVAPGYAMAEVVADRLLGGGAEFSWAGSATKLKLLGVDVASFGDPHGGSEGTLQVRLDDPVAGVYQKLVVSAEGNRLLGGVLVGDASSYGALSAMLGRRLPAEPARLLGSAGGRGGGLSATDLPDEALICSCNAVSKGAICSAVAGGARELGPLKACTRAGTGCGSCVGVVDELRRAELAAAGVEVSRALCEHFDHSRQELYDLVRVRGYSSFSELLVAHGRGRGCEICRPVVASILASRGGGYVLAGEQAALQDTNDHALANLQRDGTYSVVPRIPGGEVTPAGLAAIAAVAADHGLYTKITGAQRIDLFGARLEQLPGIWRRLIDAGFESGHAYGKALRTVKSCVGSTWCRYGVQDSVGLAILLELRYRGLRAPHKLKGGVSGCARECAEAQAKDVGVIATEEGWNLYVGGNGGARPQHARLFAQNLDTDTLIRYVDRYLMFYVMTADRLERTASWLNRLEGGLDHLREVIVDDRLGLCAELDAQMAAHVASYSCEWRQTLDDPAALAHYVSFVNAPGVADPDVLFVTERDQARPATPAERAVLVAGPQLQVVGR